MLSETLNLMGLIREKVRIASGVQILLVEMGVMEIRLSARIKRESAYYAERISIRELLIDEVPEEVVIEMFCSQANRTFMAMAEEVSKTDKH